MPQIVIRNQFEGVNMNKGIIISLRKPLKTFLLRLELDWKLFRIKNMVEVTKILGHGMRGFSNRLLKASYISLKIIF